MFTVLGASGVIGRYIVDYLHARGEDVCIPKRGDKSIFSKPLGNVIYAIGVTADFRTRPFDTIQAHVCMLSDILQKAEFDSLVYLSSTRIYSGATTSKEESVLPVKPQNPSDLYNISKIMGEALCLSSGRKKVKIARLSNVVGGEDDSTENFLPSLIREAQSGKIVLLTDPASEKDYIHINDVADLLYKISITGKNSIYNVASGLQVTHLEWVNYLSSQTGCKIEVIPDAPVIQFIPINVKKIINEFAFIPRSVFQITSSKLQ